MAELDSFQSSSSVKPSIKMIDESKLNHKNMYRIIKRILDILGSLFGLLFLSPLFLIVALLMKREEPHGPIFFSQMRVGKDEKQFKMFKFRSMCIDAEEKLEELLDHNEVDGAMFKIKDDPRVTKVGKFIRKTSIDELPQLWNVFKGEMSLVGPTPPLIREVMEYTEHDKQRLLVKPGCTGAWQVSGRNEVGFEEMVRLDIDYIENLSLWNDVKIIFKTVGVIFKPNGAY